LIVFVVSPSLILRNAKLFVLESICFLLSFFGKEEDEKLMIVEFFSADFHFRSVRLQGRLLCHLKLKKWDDEGRLWLYYPTLQWTQFFWDTCLCSKILRLSLKCFSIRAGGENGHPMTFFQKLPPPEVWNNNILTTTASGSCHTIFAIDITN